MALHKNYVEANIILADSNDAYLFRVTLIVPILLLILRSVQSPLMALKANISFILALVLLL
jgi:hypothetical protein